MLKSDKWITKFGLGGGIEPFIVEHVNSASYDVTLGSHWITPFSNGDKESTGKTFLLAPGQVVLATTKEYVRLPRDVCADLKLKSTIGRSFINHSLSGWIDGGFMGEITLELQNIGVANVQLYEGMKIAQLIFMQMEEPPEFAYGEGGRGRYQGQEGATRARKEREK